MPNLRSHRRYNSEKGRDDLLREREEREITKKPGISSAGV
jgi:hypothetical protein